MTERKGKIDIERDNVFTSRKKRDREKKKENKKSFCGFVRVYMCVSL